MHPDPVAEEAKDLKEAKTTAAETVKRSSEERNWWFNEGYIGKGLVNFDQKFNDIPKSSEKPLERFKEAGVINIFSFQRDNLPPMVENKYERAKVDPDKLIKRDTATIQIYNDKLK